MAIEIETKHRVADPRKLREALRAAGAAAGEELFERSIILDSPEHRMLAADCALRIRVRRGVRPALEECRLTYKGPRQDGRIKGREEIEQVVGDAGAMQSLLERLGFLPTIVYERRRETWRLAECEVAIDELPGGLWFVEIEGQSADDVIAAARALKLRDDARDEETYVALAHRIGRAHADGSRRLEFDPG